MKISLFANKIILPAILVLLLLPLATGTTQASTINRYLVDNNGYYSTLEHKPHDHVILTSSGAFVFFMDYDDDTLYYRYVTLDGTVGDRVQVTANPVDDFGVASDGVNVVVGYSYSGGVVAYRTGTISGNSIAFDSEAQPSISGFSPAFFTSVTCDSGGSWVSWIVYNDSNQQQYFLASKKIGTSYVWMNEVSNTIPTTVLTHRVSRDMVAYVDDDGVYVAQWDGDKFGQGTKVYNVTVTSTLLVSVQSFQRSPDTGDAILMILKYDYNLYPSGDCTEYVLMHWNGAIWLTYTVADGGAREMKQAFWTGKPTYVSVGRNAPLYLTWYWKDESWSSESSGYTSWMISSAANGNKVSALYDYDNDDIYLVVFAPEAAPQPCSLAVSITGGGSTAPQPGTYVYEAGTNVSLSAMPSSGYVFKAWLINGTTEYASKTVNFTIGGNTTALAIFDAAPPLPSYGGDDGSPDATAPPEPQQIISHGVGQVINALPEPLRAPVAFTLVGLPIILILLLITGGGATVKGTRRSQHSHRRARR